MLTLDRFRHYILMASLLVLLTGCNKQVLYSQLNELEANEMVALLSTSNIPASKEAGKAGEFSVLTSQDSFAAAVGLLRANGLPREEFDTLGSIFADEGLVPSELTKQSKLNHALSQELSNTIRSIEGVVQARVHLAVPQPNRVSKIKPPSSASIFIKHRSDVDLSSSVGQIKALVVNSIENLPYENVMVMLNEAAPLNAQSQNARLIAAKRRPDTGEYRLNLVPPINMATIVSFFVLCSASLAGGLWWRWRTKRREPVNDSDASVSVDRQ
ncbi:MAG: type III secretion inner membrane ring lipoprotein SctJ [Granulosicoccus sp.]